jgi:hypothetical protein
VGALGFHAKALLLLKPDVIHGPYQLRSSEFDPYNFIEAAGAQLRSPSVRFRLARVARSSRSFLLRRFTLDRTGSSAALIVAGLALVKFGDAG